MKLHFLGTGSAFFPTYGNTCAYMLCEKELYLLDCGESAFGILYEKGILDEVEAVYTIITHLHADHVGSLGSLISYFYCMHNMKITVVHPESVIRDLLSLEGIAPECYIYMKKMPVNRAGLDVEAVEVKHAPDMKCYGYLLRDGKECIYYSGDSAEFPEQVQNQFLAGEIDRVYHDTSTYDSPDPSHCYYGKLELAIPYEKRSRVFCMHLDSSCENLLHEKGFKIAGDQERKNE